MFINNIGTLIYTYFYGKKVAEDNHGNFFYVSKKNSAKRWVLYKKEIDPTIIPAEWQSWLTNTMVKLPSLDKKNNFFWQKERTINGTGTINAYHPKKNNHQNKINKEKSLLWKPKA